MNETKEKRHHKHARGGVSSLPSPTGEGAGVRLLFLAEEPYWLEVFVVEEGIEAGALLEPLVGIDAAVAVEVG